MFFEGQYFYSRRNPKWIEVIHVYPQGRGIEVAEHTFAGDSRKVTLTPCDFQYHAAYGNSFNAEYCEVSSEAEAKIESFKVFCNNLTRSFEKQLDYVTEPMVTIKVKPSDIKKLQQLVKYKLGD